MNWKAIILFAAAAIGGVIFSFCVQGVSAQTITVAAIYLAAVATALVALARWQLRLQRQKRRNREWHRRMEEDT